ncbi:MAG: hypothetical protein HeimC3_09250 [Candidatus Heimdallarchaeota archaeon LC_3]|nr:MAG: hypothetical protein HeimC3_09250 [Candidatus Heimdallarchaeota archaeon LC_3]
MKYILRDNPTIFTLSIIFTISIHILTTIILFLLELPFSQQLSFEILNIFLFIFVLIIIKYSVNIWASFLIVVFAVIVAAVEVFNITIKETYTYTGFRFLLISHDSTTNLPIGGYPLVIPFGWMVCLFASYSLTNLIFNNENNENVNLSRVCTRVGSDGLITGTYAMFLEATGRDLNWWIYSSGISDEFFGVPIATLYYYILFSLFFSTILRFSIYYNKKISKKNNNPITFSKLKWFSNFIPTLFVYSWLYTLLLAISQYGLYHWNIIVSGIPLIFYSGLILNNYFKKLEKEFSNEKTKLANIQILYQILGFSFYISIVLFLFMTLRVFENFIYMLVVGIFIIIFTIVWLIQLVYRKNSIP